MVVLFSLIPFLSLSLPGYFGYASELAAHFRVQYLLDSVFAVIYWLWLGQRRWLILALVCLCLNGAYVTRGYQIDPGVAPTTSASARLMLANVRTDNRYYAKLIQRIKEVRPDVLILQEVDADWLAVLISLRQQFPYITSVPRSDNFGIAVFSRWPAQTRILQTSSELPSLHIQVNGKEQDLHIVSTHPVPPVSLNTFDERNRQLTEIAGIMSRISGPKVLMGDLNTTMWSPHFQLLKARTGLVDVRDGYGVLPTWPVPEGGLNWIQSPLLMIPLDHCLVNKDVHVVNVRVGRDIASDHLPLIVDLSW